MSDWVEQITGFQYAWIDQQRQLLAGWLGSLQDAGSGIPQNAWRQMIDANEQQINSVIDAQQQMLMSLVRTFENTGNISLESVQWTRQIEEGIDSWVDMQHQLWDVWFDMLRNTSPGKLKPGNNLAKNLQDLAERAADIQEQWLSGLVNVQSVLDTSSVKRSKKTSTSKKTSRTTRKKRSKSSS